MSWRVLQSSWRFGRAATRVLVWKQSQGVKIEGTRGLFSSVRLCADDKVTHTGQKWDNDDYRNIRFTDKEKQVNEQFAISLLAEEPVMVIKGTHTWCDGGRPALGHPKIYINLDKPEIQDCGYCGMRFVAEKNKELFPKENFIT